MAHLYKFNQDQQKTIKTLDRRLIKKQKTKENKEFELFVQEESHLLVNIIYLC